MYESHFGLRHRPFRPIAESDFYYPATGHEQALAQLLTALDAEEGLALLIGEPGTGKTMLGLCLLDRLQEDACTSFLVNTHYRDRSGLLQALLYDLSLPYEGRSEQELRLALTDFLLKNYEAQRRTIVIIDEAQDLTPDLLEELRLLGNLEGKHGKAIQIVLVAQPRILKTLQLQELSSLSQRLAVRVRLECLGIHERADYLIHRLRTAGGRPESIVSDEALEVLARGSQGVPRLLNQAAHQALHLAYSAGTNLLDAEAAIEALALLNLSEGPGAEDDAESEPPVKLSEEEPVSVESEVSPQPMLVMEDEPSLENGPHSKLLKDPSRSRRLFSPPRRPA